MGSHPSPASQADVAPVWRDRELKAPGQPLDGSVASAPHSPRSTGTHTHQTWQILFQMSFPSEVLHPAASPVGGGLAGGRGRGAICAGTAASPFPSAGDGWLVGRGGDTTALF